MVDRTGINSLVSLANLAAGQALGDLQKLVNILPADPAAARDILLEAIPLLVQQYEAMAAVGAEEWYRQTRAKTIKDPYETILGEQIDPVRIQQSIRWAVGPLFDEGLPPSQGVEKTRQQLAQIIERNVKQGARSTVLANSLADGAAKRWARVPAGAETCAFCNMLASRGWVYASKKAASQSKKTGGSYHAGCDCQIVPAFGDTVPNIEGYDPDLLYRQYLFGEKELRARFPDKQASTGGGR